MKQKNLKPNKKENLAAAIDMLYLEKSSKEFKQINKKYRTTVMDMLQVTNVLSDAAELTHLFNVEVYEPVYFNNSLLMNLTIGDVFLMTLGLKDNGWDVVYISQPYC